MTGKNINFPCFQNWMSQLISMSQSKDRRENILLQIINTVALDLLLRKKKKKKDTSLWYFFVFPSSALGIYLFTFSLAFRSLHLTLHLKVRKKILFTAEGPSALQGCLFAQCFVQCQRLTVLCDYDIIYPALSLPPFPGVMCLHFSYKLESRNFHHHVQAVHCPESNGCRPGSRSHHLLPKLSDQGFPIVRCHPRAQTACYK